MVWNPAHTAAIINPGAAGGRVGRSWDRLEPQLRSRLGPIRFLITERQGHGAVLAEQAVREGARVVLSMGGDGTHNEVVNGIMAASPPAGSITLGLLPAGTGGDLSRVLDTGSSALEAAQRIPECGAPLIDIGQASYLGEDGQPASRYFVNVGSLGLSGVVDRLVASGPKWMGGTLTFYLATLRALLTYRPARVQLSLDGVDIGTHDITTVLACNARYAGGGMLFAPAAQLADGCFDVVIIRYRSALNTVGLTPYIYRGTHVNTSLVDVHRGRRLVVTPVTDVPAWIDLDGEAPGRAPVTFSVVPQAIRLIGVRPAALSDTPARLLPRP